jgi:hypothetical protein
MRRLRLYPIILVLCWTFGSINRIQNAVQPGKPIYWIYIVHTITKSFYGIVHDYLFLPAAHLTLTIFCGYFDQACVMLWCMG